MVRYNQRVKICLPAKWLSINSLYGSQTRGKTPDVLNFVGTKPSAFDLNIKPSLIKLLWQQQQSTSVIFPSQVPCSVVRPVIWFGSSSCKTCVPIPCYILIILHINCTQHISRNNIHRIRFLQLVSKNSFCFKLTGNDAIAALSKGNQTATLERNWQLNLARSLNTIYQLILWTVPLIYEHCILGEECPSAAHSKIKRF